MVSPIDHPQFVTITALDWKPLIRSDKSKQLIVDSLDFLVRSNRIKVFAFVIMDNHMHLVWQVLVGQTQVAVQRDFLKYVSQQIKFDLEKSDPEFLSEFEVNLKDRKYQFWQRNSLCVELRTPMVYEQKLEYIHNNPVKAGICKVPEEYKWSSGRFYELNDSHFSFLSIE